MKTIVIKGKEFKKAIDLARELGYTGDYIGQLCRNGKVTAELVGRTWYVDPESLTEHKSSRYRSSTKKTLSALKSEVTIRNDSTPNVRHLTIGAYESDDAPLIPSFQKETFSLPETFLPKIRRPHSDEQKVHVVSSSMKSVLEPVQNEKATFSGEVLVESLDELKPPVLEEFSTILPDKEIASVQVVMHPEEEPARVVISHSAGRAKSSFGYNVLFFTTTVSITVAILLVLSSVGSTTTITEDSVSTSYSIDMKDTAAAILSVVK